jgi:hypothetical protein
MHQHTLGYFVHQMRRPWSDQGREGSSPQRAVEARVELSWRLTPSRSRQPFVSAGFQCPVAQY